MEIDSILLIFIIGFFGEWSTQMVIRSSQVNIDDTNYSTLTFDDNKNIRDKRALGIFLQGLVQALGYNTTPIQFAFLPNPDVSKSATLIPIDVRSGRPPLAANQLANTTLLQQPRQQETLRFTGVVNFGNNSDIISHLRQYERLFHGSGNFTPIPPTPITPPSTVATPVATPGPLLQPLFVPIPIPLVENLQYPKPLLSLVTASPVTQDTNKNMQQIKYSDDENNESFEDTSDNDQTSIEVVTNNEEEENIKQILMVPQSSVGKSSEKLNSGGESEEEKNYENEEDKPNVKKNSKASKQIINNDRLPPNNQRDQNNNNFEPQDIPTYDFSERPYDRDLFRNPENYIPNKISSAEGFRVNLPIDIKPFKGQLMNSYGHSLQHNGQIDDTVADYFGKYKNPRSGIFEHLQEGDQSDLHRDKAFPPKTKHFQESSEPQDFVIQPRLKYEEYKLNTGHQQITKIPNTTDEKNTARNDEDTNEEKLSSVTQKRSKSFEQNAGNSKQTKQLNVHEETSRSRPLVSEPFDFVRFTPYYKPIQYIYSPTSKASPPVFIYQNIAGH